MEDSQMVEKKLEIIRKAEEIVMAFNGETEKLTVELYEYFKDMEDPYIILEIINDNYYNIEKKKNKTKFLQFASFIADSLNNEFKPWKYSNPFLRVHFFFNNFVYSDDLIEYLATTDSLLSLQALVRNKEKFENPNLILEFYNLKNVSKVNKTALAVIYDYLKVKR